MTNLDWICLGGIGIFGIFGWRRGLVGEGVRILAVVGGISFGFSLYQRGAFFFAHTLSFLSLRTWQIVCFIALFVAGMAVVVLLGALATKIIRLTILSSLDRVGGFLVGAAKGAVIIGFGVWMVSFLPSLRSAFSLEKTKVAFTSSRMVAKIFFVATDPHWQFPFPIKKDPLSGESVKNEPVQ